MTPLLLVAALVVLTGVAGTVVRRSHDVRHRARRQQRALDTLGQISTTRRSPEVSPPAPEPARQAHVRVVSADAEPPLSAPRPLTGGWRPTRATGAAPFRQPLAKGAHHGSGPTARFTAAESPGDVLDYTVELGSEDAVRVVHPGQVPEPPPAVTPGEAPPPPAVLTPPPPPGPVRPEPTAPPFALAGSDLAGAALPPGLPSPAPADLPDAALPAELALPAPPVAPAAVPRLVLRFDEVGSEPPAQPVHPPEPASDGPGRLEEEPEIRPLVWASEPAAAAPESVAAEEGPERATPSRPRRPGRHAALVGLGAAAAVAAILGVALAAGALHRSHHEPSTVGLPSTGSHPSRSGHPPSTTRTTLPTSPPPTVPVRLISESEGISVYQLSGPATITIRASGPCWVEIRSTDGTGPVVYEATLEAGDTESVRGPAWVRLGNPTAVSVSVNGDRVSPPVTTGDPYNLEFQ